MASPRIPLAWILVALIVGIFAFFGYQIFTAYSNPTGDDSYMKPSSVKADNSYNISDKQAVFDNDIVTQSAGPLYKPPTAIPVPHIPAQTDEDVHQTRPINQTPPDVEYAEPVATDPYDGPVHNDAEFGDNLRHPEQMIEIAPPLGSMRVPASGLGSEESYQGGNNSVNYSPEMAQNGGEFMSGIVAFDTSDGGGIGYSMI